MTNPTLPTVAFALLAGSTIVGHAETTLSDNVYPSGTIQPVLAVKTNSGKWHAPSSRVLIGLEAIPGARGQALDRYRMVADLSQVAKSVPTGCGVRLNAPWKSLRESFPPYDLPRVLAPPERKTTKSGVEYQTLSWQQGACTITAHFFAIRYKDAVDQSAYPGIDLRRLPESFQEVILRLQGSGQTAGYTNLVPYTEAKWSAKP